MIQAATVPTPATGLISTLKALFLSGEPARRAPMPGERAWLRRIALRIDWLGENDAQIGDRRFQQVLDDCVVMPLRALRNQNRDAWGEPWLGILEEVLIRAEEASESLAEGLIERGDALDLLDEICGAIRHLARS